ncbi:MAG TPA: energy transducer TonB [Candidatus Udaeobacter sp.]|nr:energy transducer TonB [Candidatus Udaeobacter sp.]
MRRWRSTGRDPQYPFEARYVGIGGSGVAVVSVDPSTGLVVSVAMSKSTGNAILDNASLAAFRRWRFAPGRPVSKVHIPVNFVAEPMSNEMKKQHAQKLRDAAARSGH